MNKTDYTIRAVDGKKIRTCPQCSRAGSYEPHKFRSGVQIDYYVHKAEYLDVCGIIMRSLDDCCSVKVS